MEKYLNSTVSLIFKSRVSHSSPDVPAPKTGGNRGAPRLFLSPNDLSVGAAPRGAAAA